MRQCEKSKLLRSQNQPTRVPALERDRTSLTCRRHPDAETQPSPRNRGELRARQGLDCTAWRPHTSTAVQETDSAIHSATRYKVPGVSSGGSAYTESLTQATNHLPPHTSEGYAASSWMEASNWCQVPVTRYRPAGFKKCIFLSPAAIKRWAGRGAPWKPVPVT